MKTLRFIVALAAALFLVAAHGQWQTPNHSVPIGRGNGVSGFGSAPAGSTGLPLVGNGTNADPSFQQVPGPGIANFVIDNTKLAPMVGPSVKCNPTVGNAAVQDCNPTTLSTAGLTPPLLDTHAGRFVPLIAGTVTGVTCNTGSPFNCFQLGQYRGNQILVNGIYQTIPPGGIVGAVGGVMAATTNACVENNVSVTTCGQTLANNTTYYVYVGMVSNTLTMIFSQSAYTVYTSASGNAVCSCDAARSLIGLIHTDPGSNTVTGTGAQQNSATWENPIDDGLTVSTTTGFSNTGAYTSLAQLTWVQWSDNVPTITLSCVVQQNSGSPGSASMGIGISGTGSAATIPSALTQITVETGNVLRQASANQSGGGSEGFTIANILGLAGSGTTYTPSNCSLQIPSRIPS